MMNNTTTQDSDYGTVYSDGWVKVELVLECGKRYRLGVTSPAGSFLTMFGHNEKGMSLANEAAKFDATKIPGSRVEIVLVTYVRRGLNERWDDVFTTLEAM